MRIKLWFRVAVTRSGRGKIFSGFCPNICRYFERWNILCVLAWGGPTSDRCQDPGLVDITVLSHISQSWWHISSLEGGQPQGVQRPGVHDVRHLGGKQCVKQRCNKRVTPSVLIFFQLCKLFRLVCIFCKILLCFCAFFSRVFGANFSNSKLCQCQTFCNSGVKGSEGGKGGEQGARDEGIVRLAITVVSVTQEFRPAFTVSLSLNLPEVPWDLRLVEPWSASRESLGFLT